jgi:hypothetical protein
MSSIVVTLLGSGGRVGRVGCGGRLSSIVVTLLGSGGRVGCGGRIGSAAYDSRPVVVVVA